MYNIHEKYSYVLVTANTVGEDDVEYGEDTLYEIMDKFMYLLTNTDYFPKKLSDVEEIRTYVNSCNTYYIGGEVAYKLFLVNDGKIDAFDQWELLYPKICELHNNM